MPEELVTTALQRAFFPSRPPQTLSSTPTGVGSIVCDNAYRALLHEHGAVRSQSRRGDCYDNAQAENRL